MYRLFYYPSNASLAPHILLREIGAPHELVLVDRTRNAQKQDDYLALNPLGRIPTLVDGDLVLFETAAICLHLADRHPDAGLAPPVGTDARSVFHKWLAYLATTIQTDYLAYYYPERYTTDTSDAARAAVKAATERRLHDWFDVIEAELDARGPWLLGETYSLLDPYLFLMTRWGRSMARPPKTRPSIGAHAARVLARPAVTQAVALEKLAEPVY